MKNKEKITPVERFLLLIKPDGKEIKNVYIYAAFSGLVNLSLPLGIQSIVNLIQGGKISTAWMVLVLVVLLGITLNGVLKVGQLRITEHLEQKIFTRAAFEFAYRIPKIKLEAMYKHYAPELMNRFFDVLTVQKGLSKILIDFSTALIQVIFGLLLLAMYHPFFIGLSLLLTIIVFFIFQLAGRKGLKTSLLESKSKYKVAHWLQEVARTSISFKLAGETDLPLERVNKSVKKYVEHREAHFKILILQFAMLIVFKVMIVAGLLIVGSVLVIEQQMNIGQFVASEIIVLMVMGSVEKLILSLETIYDVLTALEKIGEVTDLELDENTGMDLTTLHPDSKGFKVELSNVTFKYPYQERLIFMNANILIHPSERIAISGKSSSGKATLLYLLAGVYKIESGYIAYDDIPLGNLNPNKLRSEIGDCLMDELLFEGSLLENITMGRKKATFENVEWAIKNIGLSEFVKTLPNGYDTVIQQQGKQFSKGIVDKIRLCRSIVDKPKLLLIKDVFSSSIGNEKYAIIDFLVAPENSWSLVIATDDEQVLNRVDKAYFINADKNFELV